MLVNTDVYFMLVDTDVYFMLVDTDVYFLLVDTDVYLCGWKCGVKYFFRKTLTTWCFSA